MTATAPPRIHPEYPVVIKARQKRAEDVQLEIADAITAFAGSMPFVYRPGSNPCGADVEEDDGRDDTGSRADTDMLGAPWGNGTRGGTAMGELQPRMRAGDQERQRVVEKLGKHFGEGRLTVEEFDDRVVRAHASVYLDELPALTADLPGDQEPHRRPTRARMPVPRGVLVLLLAVLLAWSMVAAVITGAPPIFAVFLLFMFLRHRRVSRRW